MSSDKHNRWYRQGRYEEECAVDKEKRMGTLFYEDDFVECRHDMEINQFVIKQKDLPVATFPWNGVMVDVFEDENLPHSVDGYLVFKVENP